MKAKIIPILTIIFLTSPLFFSCEDLTVKEYTAYAPVYLSYDNLRSSLSTTQTRGLENPGKIYFKDNYIFIVEELKGIHVFDNSDPASPVNKAFITLPGVVDISISGYILYADSYVDLAVLDIEDINNIHEVGRLKDILPYTVPQVPDTKYPTANVDMTKGVVIDWELRTIKEKIINNPNPYPIYYDKGGIGFMASVNSSGASSGVSGSGVGVGGSMARFGIKGKVLYVVDQSVLKVLDISNKVSPVKLNDIYTGWNVQTLFLTEKTMFLGTTTGMVIYDITNPGSPVSQAFFNHARSCDPVIVDDTLAYVTLRSGTTCGGNVNTLDVVNIKNINSPVQLISYPLVNPHGLGKHGDLLFVCDGSSGLKVFDASDPLKIANNLIYTYSGINAYDVIPVGNVLILIADDGLHQYDYSDVKNITLLSTIPIVKIN